MFQKEYEDACDPLYSDKNDEAECDMIERILRSYATRKTFQA
jgi:hypothetical protein